MTEASVRNGTGDRVLLVEDDGESRRTLAAMITALGYAVETASNGREAIERYRAEPTTIGVVVTDLDMPVLDGEGLIERLVAHRSPCAVLVLSGNSGNLGPELVRREDAVTTFLRKPVALEELGRALAEAVAHYRRLGGR